jgi:hypothetical protein
LHVNGFVDVVKARNKMAKSLGYIDYYDYKVITRVFVCMYVCMYVCVVMYVCMRCDFYDDGIITKFLHMNVFCVTYSMCVSVFL